MEKPVNEPSVISSAWARMLDRWGNFLLVVLQFMVIPMILAAFITVGALIALPFILVWSKGPDTNQIIQVVAALAAIILPVVALVSALYRNLVGSIASVKSIIDDIKNRKTSINESKKLLTPFIHFITIQSLINIGFLIYIPITLLFAALTMSVWTQFAVFAFIKDEKRGTASIWKGFQMYKENFWYVTGRIFLLQIATIIVSNIGTIISTVMGHEQGMKALETIGGLQLLTFILSFLLNVYSVAYTYELYKRLKQPETVRVPKIWLAFSILGWLIGLGLIGWGVQYLLTHPIQLPTPPTQAPQLDSSG